MLPNAHDTPFSDVLPAYLSLTASYGTTRTYAKNTILINEGDESDSLYVILSGKVKVYTSDESGKEAVVNIQGPGEYFGELALIDSAPRSASVMTLEKSQLAVCTRRDFQRCVQEHPEITLELLKPLVRRIRALTETVRNLALLDVYGRVAHTLLKLATEKDGEQVIEQRLTHQEIANMVGASREMVSRIMKDLSTGGYIRIENKQIRIPGKLPAAW